MKNNEYIIQSRSCMDEVARKIALNANIGTIVLLSGNLGVGKTFLCREIIKYISNNPNIIVPSPTFNIVQIYQFNYLSVYHYDLYRIKHELELYELGIEDAIQNGICLIEWPEIAMNILSKTKFISIRFLIEEEEERYYDNQTY